ncbi:hypothetical protein PHLGIDRAFT_118572 [Phlebiopsis gigantea 11061_1 CR5-6]|uniref:F-box domain-containing protein n=1 Tax=Phlebiopsis gigantea (strain 11061_1 CR5-6) TaxID=745531 RepID=A0A0C3S7N9_PHLG1|nr:hypothetical protein PHLGIDRAFT_118572 [Phlebiopsis gigantea 11061_1 CR5-6]
MSTRQQLTWQMSNNIIDNLSGDTSMLMSCSLVCKTWLLRSRRHMFLHARISSEDRLRLYLNLLALPHSTFRTSVEEIVIQSSPDKSSNRMTLKYGDFVWLLARLPSVQSVSLDAVTIIQENEEVASILAYPTWSPLHLSSAIFVDVTWENNTVSTSKLVSLLHLFHAVDHLAFHWGGQNQQPLKFKYDAKVAKDGRAATKFKALPRINSLLLLDASEWSPGYMRCLIQMDLYASLTTLVVFIADRGMLVALGNVLRSPLRSLKKLSAYTIATDDLMDASAEEIAKHLDLSKCTSLIFFDFGLVFKSAPIELRGARLRWQWDTAVAMLYSLPPDTLHEIRVSFSPRCNKPSDMLVYLADIPWYQLNSAVRRFPNFVRIAVDCPEYIGKDVLTLAAAVALAVGNDIRFAWRIVEEDVYP